MNPFQEFQNWLFDGKKDSKIPEDLLKSSSPVSQLFAIRMFKNNGKLNYYLNKYLNTYDVFQIEREELFYFLKRCVIDYRITRKSIPYFKGFRKDKHFNVLKQRFPLLKNDDIDLLSELIQNSDNKNDIMMGLGMSQDYKKSKTKKSDKKQDKKMNEDNKPKEKNTGTSLDEFLTKNFVCFDVN